MMARSQLAINLILATLVLCDRLSGAALNQRMEVTV